MKKAGVWIDKKEAKIISIESENEQIKTIVSNVEDYRPSGGSGTRLKGGPQDVVQDSKFLEREKHQLADYFKKITHLIKDADDVVIFGPAQTGDKLYKELSEQKLYNFESLSVMKADSLTENQIIAWVRDYYASR
jgi:hypothetical protein